MSRADIVGPDSTAAPEAPRDLTGVRWLAVGLAIIAVVISVGTLLGLQSIARVHTTQEEVRASNEVELALAWLLSTEKDAETGQRGFLLTGKEAYLAPFLSAKLELENQFEGLHRLVAGNANLERQLATLRALSDQKIRELDATVNAQRTEGKEAALQIVNSDLGKSTMDDMRNVATSMVAEENQHRLQTRLKLAQNLDAAQRTILVSGILGLALCLAFAVLQRQYLRYQALSKTALFRQKELLAITLASIGDGVISSDTSGKVLFLNGVAQRLTGWSMSEALGQPLEEVFNVINEDTREHVVNPALRAMREGVVVGLANHSLLVSKSGAETPIDDSGAPVRDLAGKTFGAVLVFRDIIERKMQENAIKEGERRKDEFLATLAHELRNPLAPLRNALQILAQHGPHPPVTEKLMAMMNRQVDQIVRLVDDLFDVARITKGQLELRREITDTQRILDIALETCGPMLREGKHVVEVTVPPKAPLLDGDPTRLSQLLCNLIGNAVKYSELGQPIAIEVTSSESEVTFRVRDRGVGIPPDQIPRIFEMFSQVDRSLERSKSGLGIGLSLARQIADMHGGTLAASSEGVGKGSEFVVRLPAAPVGITSATEAPPRLPPAPPIRPLNIVLADDNLDSAESLSLLLRAHGHTVQVVHNGVDAFTLASAVKPQLVLLDIGMPKLNGYEVARRIRREPWGEQARLIAITGWGQDDDKRRARDAGFDAHLLKPIRMEALEETLAQLGF